MSQKAWFTLALVQLFGDLGPWAGLRMKSALGPALWFTGIIIMMPGRLVSLWLMEKVLWGVRLTTLESNVVFIVTETAVNVCFWLLCARLIRSLRRRRPTPNPAS